MSDFPPDEFDEVPEDGDRQGVHRGHNPHAGAGSRNGFLALVATGVLALAVGAVAFVNAPRTAQDTGQITPSPSGSITTSTVAPSPSGSSARPSADPGDSRAPQGPSTVPEKDRGREDELPGNQPASAEPTDLDAPADRVPREESSAQAPSREPDAPVVPGVPEAPQPPPVPQAPAVPQTPAVPDAPAAPGVPVSPALPGQPAPVDPAPLAPGGPGEVPAVPELPAQAAPPAADSLAQAAPQPGTQAEGAVLLEPGL